MKFKNISFFIEVFRGFLEKPQKNLKLKTSKKPQNLTLSLKTAALNLTSNFEVFRG